MLHALIFITDSAAHSNSWVCAYFVD